MTEWQRAWKLAGDRLESILKVSNNEDHQGDRKPMCLMCVREHLAYAYYKGRQDARKKGKDDQESSEGSPPPCGDPQEMVEEGD